MHEAFIRRQCSEIGEAAALELLRNIVDDNSDESSETGAGFRSNVAEYLTDWAADERGFLHRAFLSEQTAAEQHCYAALRDNVHGVQIRLEQELIGFDYVRQELAKAGLR